MPSKKIAIMGIPIDNLNMAESVHKILDLIDAYKNDHIPRYIGTLNVDFLVNTHTISWNKVRHPELLRILRECSVATPDGTPIVWLSRLMQSPLKERVAGSDLFPHLAVALSTYKKSIFLLGGEEQVTKVAGVILEAIYPGLKIVGTATPYIYVEGDNLENAQERDDLLIEEINAAAPDVLIINLGNPKQEIWFERVKKKLKVPVSIGVGGSYDLTVGAIPRAPIWMQSIGFEWLYRFIHEPKRMWKRYIPGGFKFFLQAFPLVLYHRINGWLSKWKRDQSAAGAPRHPLLLLSQHQTIALYQLPKILDGSHAEELLQMLKEAFSQDAIIFDFSATRHITLEGLSGLIEMWEKAREAKRRILTLGVNGDLRFLLKLHRIWDLIKPTLQNSPQAILKMMVDAREAPDFFESLQQEHEHVIVTIFGNLVNDFDYQRYYEKLVPILSGKHAVMELKYCTGIENRGFTFLLDLKKHQESTKMSFKVRGLTPEVKHLFHLAKIKAEG